MKTRLKLSALIFFCLSCISSTAFGEDIYRLRMFFGLSIPDGGGVSLKEWEAFVDKKIATTFAGFNIVDSTGYYQGEPERSKVVTLIVEGDDDIQKAKALAADYARQFHQDSVMIVKVPVLEWCFVGEKEDCSVPEP